MADPVVQIVVNVYEDGTLTVHAPLHDKEWCLSALHRAIEQVVKYKQPKLPPLEAKSALRPIDLAPKSEVN